MTGTIALGSSELSVSEVDNTILVPIIRTGDLSGPVSIQYATRVDTATDGADYVGTSGTVTMAAGQTRVDISVKILDDTLSEPTETFVFSVVNVDNGVLQAPRTARINILDNETPAQDPPTPPLVSNYNVTQQAVISGMNQPIRFKFDPHNPNQMYVAEKGGVIKIYNASTGSFVSTFVDIHDKVNQAQDRGLMDIALHPNFPSQPYVYAFYVVDPLDTAGKSGNAGPDGGGNRFSYLVRFTADPSTNYTTAVPGSEVVLLGKSGKTLADISGSGAIDSTSDTSIIASDIANNSDPSNPIFKPDYLKVDSRSHAGGSLAFGPDGALYVSTGDGTSFNFADARAVGVQNLNSLSGKILRIDPMTGKGLLDNPFVQSGTSLDSVRAKVFDLGLRNPFSIAFDSTGKLMLTDTGSNSWEEINLGAKGANFGWPFYEGGDNGVLQKPTGYRDMAAATSFYNAVAAGSIVVTAAFRAFAHADSTPGYQVQAITGGSVFYSGNKYPAELTNDYFFSDYAQREIYSVDVNDRRDVKFILKTPSFAPVHYAQGSDGYVYYADIANGSIGRLLISLKPIDGTSGNDKLTGTAFGDIMHGFAGNDTLDGGGNADTMAGGLGNDLYIVDNSGDTIVEAANEGTDKVQASVNFDLAANVENLTLTGTSVISGNGNTLNNALTGNGAANTLSGGAGNDTLIGGTGNDRLDGGTGNDRLDGGSGADSMDGGAGNDTYFVENSGDKVIELAGGGTDIANSYVTYVLPDNVENLRLQGNALLSGTGNALNNQITGNPATNNLQGLAGNDTIIGSGGNDKLAGGLGNDVFVFNAILNQSSNVDQITDFAPGADKIQLENNGVFTALTATATLAAGAFNHGSTAGEPDDRILYDQSTGTLYYDADGSGTAASPIKFAILTNKPVLSNSDFVVI